jgi:hypothetical protein
MSEERITGIEAGRREQNNLLSTVKSFDLILRAADGRSRTDYL